MRLAAEAEALLEGYTWPGNVRELRNVIERAVILAATDAIGPADLDLPVDASEPPDSVPLPQGPVRLEDLEREHIARVLRQVGGSKTRAASLLGISRSTLWEKAKRYGIV